jgi:hypothetical protein
VTADELRHYCQGHIDHFKISNYIMILESLPRTVTGKIRKPVLKENAIGDLGLGEAGRIEAARWLRRGSASLSAWDGRRSPPSVPPGP